MGEFQADQCVRNDTARNGTSVGMPNFHFSGIPETLIINGVIASILLIVFVLLKKSAWAFKKLQIKGEASRFAAVFYGPPSDPPRHNGGGEDGGGSSDDDSAAREEQDLIREGSGGLSWIWVAAFKLKAHHFRQRCGQDAVEYLDFQRLLITVLSIAALSSLAILLPINVIFGTLQRGLADYYGQTTLSNIDARTYWVLFHIGLTILLLPIVMVLVRRVLRIRLKSAITKQKPWARLTSGLDERSGFDGIFSAKNKWFFSVCNEQRYRALMISNVTTVREADNSVIDKNIIRRHFDEAYPKVEIESIEYTYNSTALQGAVDEKRRLDFCRDFYAARQQQFGPDHEKSIIRPVKCKLCCGSCRGEDVNGVQFYEHECGEAEKRMQRKYNKMLREPTSVIFVNFATYEQAEHVNRDFDWTERVFCCGLCSRRPPRESSVSEELGVNVWNARLAPLPRFINWRNLSYGGWLWWIRSIAINFVIFWVVFFLSTPPLVLNFLSDKFRFLLEIPILSQWLPTIVLLGVPILLPIVILMSVQWIGYYSLVTELSYQLRNLFLFLLLTLVILPGVGMTSAEAVFQWLQGQVMTPNNSSSSGSIQWECVFIPSSGAFFVNFIIGLALVGNALDLLRIGPLVWFEIQRIAFARTEAERTWINLQRAEFPYPSHYSTMLIVYTIAIVYGYICPLVMPFALLYFILKHVIDKYNIFFTTARTVYDKDGGNDAKLSSGVHITATRYLFLGIFMQQFILTFFAIIRQVPVAAYVIILVSTVLTGIFLIYEFWFAEFIDPELVEAYHEQTDKDDLVYAPPVVSEYQELLTKNSNQSNGNNGSLGKGGGQNSGGSPSKNNVQRPPAVDQHQINQAIAIQMQPT